MTDPEKKGFWYTLGNDIGVDMPKLKEDFNVAKSQLSEIGVEVKEVAWDKLSKAEKVAAIGAIKAEEAWDKFDVNDRLYGATAGGKIGLLFGLRAGPKGAAAGAAVGGVVGLVVGDKAVRKFRTWRDSHKDAEPANDQQKPTDDGPSL